MAVGSPPCVFGGRGDWDSAALLLEGDFFVGTALAVALVKLTLRYGTLAIDAPLKHRMHGEVRRPPPKAVWARVGMN
jgi:hypothetical protein